MNTEHEIELCGGSEEHHDAASGIIVEIADKVLRHVGTAVAKFQVGKTYRCTSPCDHNCTWDFLVVSRTPSTVTFLSPEHPARRREPIRKKVSVYDGAETCQPLGKYSLSPVLTAEKLVA